MMWMVYFTISRVIFLFYYSDLFTNIGFLSRLQALLYGLKLDLAMTAYIAVIPFLIIAVTIWSPIKISKNILYFYTFILISIINTLMFFDLGLYGAWGIRLDAMFLTFLSTPKSMFASVTTATLLITVIVWILSSILYFYAFKKGMDIYFDQLKKGKHWHFLILLLAVFSLVIAMRGGFQTIPINQSDVYFSEKMISNHTAENFAWTFAKSASYNVHGGKNPFERMDKSEADKLIQKVRNERGKPNISASNITSESIINRERPNIIIIIWESLTAKIVGPLGGEKGITENLNQFAKEGILFESFYANGSRSDKGIVALLSGYYPQPGQSIMKMPGKSRSLPSLPRSLSNLGYTTSFHYGGDLNFGNMVSYLRNIDVNQMTSEDDFNRGDKNSKWGAHDHILFDKYLAQKKSDNQPFFDVIFTLSSHEPFEFPGAYKFGQEGEVDKFKSAHAYTDKSVGDFVRNAKKEEWWDNTLLIIVADHGHQLPRQENSHVAPSRFHIPMLWMGGAVTHRDTIISNIGSQIDLPYTLLSLLEGEKTDFIWSQNLLSSNSKNYAHYIYTKGFGTLNSEGCVVYDYNAKKSIYSKGPELNNLERIGSAITQTAYQDFLDRK